MEWNNIKVVQESIHKFKVYIDGVEIHGIRAFNYSNSVNEVPYIEMELVTGGKVDFDINSCDK